MGNSMLLPPIPFTGTEEDQKIIDNLKKNGANVQIINGMIVLTIQRSPPSTVNPTTDNEIPQKTDNDLDK